MLDDTHARKLDSRFRSAAPSSPRRRPLRLLLIEDNPADARLVREELADVAAEHGAHAPFAVTNATSLEEGLRILAAAPVDAVLLDLGLPDGQGLEALQRLRSRAPAVPVVVLTGRVDPELAHEVVRHGALDYLVKGETSRSVLARLLRYAAEGARLAGDRSRAERRRARKDQARRLAAHQQQEVERLRRLAEAALALNTTLAPDAILQVLAERARQLVGAHVAIASLDGEDGLPAVTAIESSAWHRRHGGAQGGPDVQELAALGRTAADHHATLRLSPAELRALGAGPLRREGPALRRVPRGWLAAPLLGTDGRRIGLVQLWDKPVSRGGRDGFSDDDEAVLVQLAHVASVAAENARLFGEVRDAVQARDELLAGVTHDLRNPLASIRGYAQLLLRQERREPAPRPLVVRALETIDTTTTRMERMLDELLDVARVRAGQPLTLKREPDDLVALARQAVESQQATTQAHTVRLESGETELIGEWDASRLARVLDNLIGNAIKYSPGGGFVTVTVGRSITPDGTAVAELRVRDFGVGVPEADRPHVFERFSRGGNVLGRIPGVGIGLAGASQIVAQHGGTIDVESAEGQGSLFTVRLPLAAGVVLAPRVQPVPSGASAGTSQVDAPAAGARARDASGGAAVPSTPIYRGRVLVVEDDALTRTLLCDVLRDEGYEVLDADDGVSALHAVRNTAPDVILLDLLLPAMDGASFARHYRDETASPAPIIVVTATAETSRREQVAAAAVVRKPFIVDELVQLVERHAVPRAA